MYCFISRVVDRDITWLRRAIVLLLAAAHHCHRHRLPFIPSTGTLTSMCWCSCVGVLSPTADPDGECRRCGRAVNRTQVFLQSGPGDDAPQQLHCPGQWRWVNTWPGQAYSLLKSDTSALYGLSEYSSIHSLWTASGIFRMIPLMQIKKFAQTKDLQLTSCTFWFS